MPTRSATLLKKKASSTDSDSKNMSSWIRCFNCGEEGHLRCRRLKNSRVFKDGADTLSKYKVGFCMIDRPPLDYTVAGTINGSHSSSFGCNCVIVSEEAVPYNDVSSWPKVPVEDFIGRVSQFPVVRCLIGCTYCVSPKETLQCPYWKRPWSSRSQRPDFLSR